MCLSCLSNSESPTFVPAVSCLCSEWLKAMNSELLNIWYIIPKWISIVFLANFSPFFSFLRPATFSFWILIHISESKNDGPRIKFQPKPGQSHAFSEILTIDLRKGSQCPWVSTMVIRRAQQLQPSLYVYTLYLVLFWCALVEAEFMELLKNNFK